MVNNPTRIQDSLCPVLLFPAFVLQNVNVYSEIQMGALSTIGMSDSH